MQQDKEISDILDKLDGNDLDKLNAWMAQKFSGKSARPSVKQAENVSKPATKNSLFGDLTKGSALRSVAKPKDQSIVLPDPDLPLPDDEAKGGIMSDFLKNANKSGTTTSGFNVKPTYEISNDKFSKALTEEEYQNL